MEAERLDHLIKLASIKASVLGRDEQSRAEWMEYISDASRSDLHNEYNCLSIMAEAFVELVKLHGHKPRFRVPADTRAA